VCPSACDLVTLLMNGVLERGSVAALTLSLTAFDVAYGRCLHYVPTAQMQQSLTFVWF